MSVSFGIHLRQLRLAAQVSQPKLADRVGVDHSYISRLESGLRHPSIGMAQNLAKALNANTEDTANLLFAGGFILQPDASIYHDKRIEKIDLAYDTLGPDLFRKVNVLLDVIINLIGE